MQDKGTAILTILKKITIKMFLWKISFAYRFLVSRIMKKSNEGSNFNELAKNEHIENCYIKKVLSMSLTSILNTREKTTHSN